MTRKGVIFMNFVENFYPGATGPPRAIARFFTQSEKKKNLKSFWIDRFLFLVFGEATKKRLEVKPNPNPKNTSFMNIIEIFEHKGIFGGFIPIGEKFLRKAFKKYSLPFQKTIF